MGQNKLTSQPSGSRRTQRELRNRGVTAPTPKPVRPQPRQGPPVQPFLPGGQGGMEELIRTMGLGLPDASGGTEAAMPEEPPVDRSWGGPSTLDALSRATGVRNPNGPPRGPDAVLGAAKGLGGAPQNWGSEVGMNYGSAPVRGPRAPGPFGASTSEIGMPMEPTQGPRPNMGLRPSGPTSSAAADPYATQDETVGGLGGLLAQMFGGSSTPDMAVSPTTTPEMGIPAHTPHPNGARQSPQTSAPFALSGPEKPRNPYEDMNRVEWPTTNQGFHPSQPYRPSEQELTQQANRKPKTHQLEGGRFYGGSYQEADDTVDLDPVAPGAREMAMRQLAQLHLGEDTQQKARLAGFGGSDPSGEQGAYERAQKTRETEIPLLQQQEQSKGALAVEKERTSGAQQTNALYRMMMEAAQAGGRDISRFTLPGRSGGGSIGFEREQRVPATLLANVTAAQEALAAAQQPNMIGYVNQAKLHAAEVALNSALGGAFSQDPAPADIKAFALQVLNDPTLDGLSVDEVLSHFEDGTDMDANEKAHLQRLLLSGGGAGLTFGQGAR